MTGTELVVTCWETARVLLNAERPKNPWLVCTVLLVSDRTLTATELKRVGGAI